MKNTTVKEEGKRVEIILSARAKNLLLPNRMIKQKIADAMGLDYFTIHRWIREDDEKITQGAAMKVIREETGLTDELLLTERVSA
jgi:hypothetical protein